jgi:hypothetical protein
MMDQDDRKLRDKPDQRKAEEHRLVSAVSPWYHTILRLSFCLSKLSAACSSSIAVFDPKLLRSRTTARAFALIAECQW